MSKMNGGENSNQNPKSEHPSEKKDLNHYINQAFSAPDRPFTRKDKWRVFWKSTGVVAIACILFAGSFLFHVFRDLPPMEMIQNPETHLSSQVFTADGKLIRTLYEDENRIKVPLDEVSVKVTDALIATEDHRFYEHNGIDFKAIGAVLGGMIDGEEVRGASTISMQLARNLYDQIGTERTLERKVKEMIVALYLEKEFTKEEILITYLNTVSFVGNSYGIQNGAQIYLQKDAKDLNTEEAALLVGLLKGTTFYSPLKHPDRALERRNTVLDLMAEHAYLSPADADSLKKTEIQIAYKPAHLPDKAPYLTEHVRLEARKWCDEHGYNLYQDGLKIYTTIDTRMQQHAEKAVEKHMKYLQPIFHSHISGREPWRRDSSILIRGMRDSERYQKAVARGKSDEEIFKEWHTPVKMPLFTWDGVIEDTMMTPMDSLKYYAGYLEAGFVAIDPTSGKVKAWVGGINFDFFKYDHVAKGKRQVGSTFKPFVYTVAMDRGYQPCDLQLNEPVQFIDPITKKVIWEPKNSEGNYGGLMTLADGMAYSVNLVTARLMKDITPAKVCEYAYRMGIESQLDCVPSLALGTTDLSVLELAGAYSTFANQGVYNKPYVIERIEDKDGNIIAHFGGESRRAISEETAFTMVNMLRRVVTNGTARRLQGRYSIPVEMGGKTGTTQNHSDGWFVGITPQLSAGVWVGCADRKMRFRTIHMGQGARMALPIWGNFMQAVYHDDSIQIARNGFNRPAYYNVTFDCNQYHQNILAEDWWYQLDWTDTSDATYKWLKQNNQLPENLAKEDEENNIFHDVFGGSEDEKPSEEKTEKSKKGYIINRIQQDEQQQKDMAPAPENKPDQQPTDPGRGGADGNREEKEQPQQQDGPMRNKGFVIGKDDDG